MRAAQVVVDAHADGGGKQVHPNLFIIDAGDIAVMVKREAVTLVFQQLFLRA